jgi:hypothetical protein
LSGDHPTVRLARRVRGAVPPMSSVLPSAHTQTWPAARIAGQVDTMSAA